jgi:hypothetical protein
VQSDAAGQSAAVKEKSAGVGHISVFGLGAYAKASRAFFIASVFGVVLAIDLMAWFKGGLKNDELAKMIAFQPSRGHAGTMGLRKTKPTFALWHIYSSIETSGVRGKSNQSCSIRIFF